MRKATIIDVAEQAGVSWKTVARVVNDEPGVKAANIVRVREAISQLGYRPNKAARSLKSERSFLIGLLSVTMGAHYLLPFSRGAAPLCRSRGYHLLLEHLRWPDPDLLAMVDSILQNAAFHALILPPPLCNDAGVIDRIHRQGIRVLLLDPIARDGAHPFIDVDDEPGVVALVDHAVSLGHHRFAYVAGADGHRASIRRRSAYLAALTAHGRDDIVCLAGDFTFASGFAAGEALFGSDGAAPTFVFAANDDMAAGVLAAAVRAGRRVPDDVSIAGFDDSDVTRQVWPPLTTIHQPIEAIGAAAIDILTRPPAEADRVLRRFPVSLTVRGSTGPAPGTAT